MISDVYGLGRTPSGPVRPHEIHGHLRRSLVGPIDFLDLARRKSKRCVDTKARDFCIRMSELADSHSLRQQSFEQTHRLEEVKREGLLPELLFNLCRQLDQN